MTAKELRTLIVEVLNERENEKVGDYKYYGFSNQQEKEIFNKIIHYHEIKTKDSLSKERIENEFDTLYQYIVGRNPVLKDINVYVDNYDPKRTPRKDLISGVIASIPPEDIKNWIELTKGFGLLKVPKNYQVDSSETRYVKLKKVD